MSSSAAQLPTFSPAIGRRSGQGPLRSTLRPRETRTLEVAPGRHLVAVIDASGRLLYQSPVTLGPRTAYDVTFQGGVTVLPQRPAGPPVAWAR